MTYKPYSSQWHRKRYLSEAIQKYFEDGESSEDVLIDIIDILTEWRDDYITATNKIDKILTSLEDD